MDQMAMAQAVMAFRTQAEAWLRVTKESLAAAGRGFSSDDVTAIEAAEAAHPFPEGHGPGMQATPEQLAQAREVARQAMTAEYPPNGFPTDDPRLEPVEGVTLALHAIAGKAIGWSTDDAFIDRVATALGIDPAVYRRAAAEWSRRCGEDVVLATFYGQLFSQAERSGCPPTTCRAGGGCCSSTGWRRSGAPTRTGDGKVVWFELERAAPTA